MLYKSLDFAWWIKEEQADSASANILGTPSIAPLAKAAN